MDRTPAQSYTPVPSTLASPGPFDSTAKSPGTKDGAYFTNPTTVGYADDGPEVVPQAPPPGMAKTYEGAPYENAAYGNAAYGNAVYENGKEHTVEKRICGLTRLTFILSVVLAVVVVVAAVGGGVGGSLAVKAARESRPTVTITVSGSATTTGTGTNTASTATDITVPTAGTVALDCPSLTSSTKSISLNSRSGASWSFSIACGTDYVSDSADKQIDIVAMLAYTLTDCITACAMYNANLGSDGCVAVEFNSDLTKSLATWDANCWLKNSTGSTRTDDSNNSIAGARLTGS